MSHLNLYLDLVYFSNDKLTLTSNLKTLRSSDKSVDARKHETTLVPILAA